MADWFDIDEELREKLRSDGCIPGCGECCTLVSIPAEKRKEVEENISNPLPQYPSEPMWKEKSGKKNIVLVHPDGTEECKERLCPFAYAGDAENYTPFPDWTVEEGSFTCKSPDSPDGKADFKAPQIRVKVPEGGKTGIFCGLHYDIRENPVISKLFPGCKSFTIWTSRVEEYCVRGALAYQKRNKG